MAYTTPIATAILSYGMSGEVFHAPLLEAHPGFALQTIVQRRARTAQLRYPQISIAGSVAEVLQDPAIELVVVNTPNATHAEFVAAALAAGKHVVVEKPFTVTSAEANQLIALAHAHQRVLTVFQNRRWDGDFLTLQQIVNSRAVGTIVELEAHYDRFRNYIEADTWKEESGPGTGILYNLGSHMLDQIITLFGMPHAVDARLGIQRPGGRVEDFYDIRLQYDGHQAIVKSSYLVREGGPRYSVHGTEGSYIKYGLDPQEQALKEGKTPGSAGWGVEDPSQWGKLNTTLQGLHITGQVETRPGNYPQFYHGVYDAIREGKEPPVLPQESLEGIKLIEACYESNRLRQSVRLS
ncbi:Gfo/Idh/MocA family oxidoreductase [Parachryseolinea silvisoli]|uniref:Gfo/Idh/MocA family oxidoreductase n=1 Tax=Parachryseolinea silvisoli TaxID=2873601 RepID=UPI002265D29F|nr:Gfo/Idh/MocA family oxidoreductase [Parachryseolinea silvisoli]MCD9014625.1 Gfo/Idh/MocA family oxidoreductase [Parachryseolinea silvisoli]